MHVSMHVWSLMAPSTVPILQTGTHSVHALPVSSNQIRPHLPIHERGAPSAGVCRQFHPILTSYTKVRHITWLCCAVFVRENINPIRDLISLEQAHHAIMDWPLPVKKSIIQASLTGKFLVSHPSDVCCDHQCFHVLMQGHRLWQVQCSASSQLGLVACNKCTSRQAMQTFFTSCNSCEYSTINWDMGPHPRSKKYSPGCFHLQWCMFDVHTKHNGSRIQYFILATRVWAFAATLHPEAYITKSYMVGIKLFSTTQNNIQANNTLSITHAASCGLNCYPVTQLEEKCSNHSIFLFSIWWLWLIINTKHQINMAVKRSLACAQERRKLQMNDTGFTCSQPVYTSAKSNQTHEEVMGVIWTSAQKWLCCRVPPSSPPYLTEELVRNDTRIMIVTAMHFLAFATARQLFSWIQIS